MKAVAKKLARELGPSHRILSSYVVNQTPQRTMPLLQLIELYISLKGDEAFIENFLDEDELYQGFLSRVSSINGNIRICYQGSLIAEAKI